MRRLLTYALFCAMITTAAQAQALVLGTNNNDFLFFQGASQAVTTSISNAYTGEMQTLNGTFNVNIEIYDGLGGLDTLIGTDDPDLLSLRDGSNNQTIFNTERILFGDGADFLDLSDASFILGNMVIDGGAGADILWLNTGNDLINGKEGNDIINGGPGNDEINGGIGDDRIFFGFGSGFDTINGEDGFDEIVFASGITISDLSIISEPDAFTASITLGADKISSLNVEQLRFADGSTLDLTSPLPEPSTFLLFGPGLAGLFAFARQRRKASALQE